MKLLFTLFILFYFIVDFVSQIDEAYDLTNGTYKAFCLLSCPLGPSLRVIFLFFTSLVEMPSKFPCQKLVICGLFSMSWSC